jgi:hypothetical protein
MSDLRVTCPGCGASSNDVGLAFLEGRPCKFCGFECDHGSYAIHEAGDRTCIRCGLATPTTDTTRTEVSMLVVRVLHDAGVEWPRAEIANSVADAILDRYILRPSRASDTKVRA